MREAPQKTLTRAFRDGGLEQEYRADFAERSRTHYRLIVAATLFLWLAVIPLDPQLAGSETNLRVVFWMRIIVAVFIALGVVVGWSKPQRFARWSQLVMSLALGAMLVGVALVVFVVPEPWTMDTRMNTAGFLLVAVAGYSAAPLRPLAAAIPTLSASTLAGVGSAIHTDHMGITCLWLVIANSVGLIGSHMLDNYRRRAFLFARMLDAERAKSDGLIGNLLPDPIARQLRESRGRIADHHEEVTVLFADIVGFTPIAQQLSPDSVVSMLDELFSRFDALVESRGLEKIKTIGDAYMAVGGLPTSRSDHVEAVADLALAMSEATSAYECPISGRPLALRVGIHTGPVVAGVIGTRKLVYDLWGDTVNTASRMESHAEDGTIQVSDASAKRLRAFYDVRERGLIDIKGKGPMTTYVLCGPQQVQ